MKKAVALFLTFIFISIAFVSAKAENTDADTDTTAETVYDTEAEETVSEPETDTEAETETGDETAADTENEADTTTVSENEDETDTGTDTDTISETDTETDTGSEPDTDTGADTDTDDEISVETDTEPETEAETVPETETDTETETDADAATDTDTDEDTKTDTDTEKESETETDTDTDEETEHLHEIVYVEEIPASCTEGGVAAHYECKSCGMIFWDNEGNDEITDDNELYIEPTGHIWGEWETVLEPTALSPGMERRICEYEPEDEVVLTVTLDAGHGKYDNKGVINGYYEGRMTYTLMSYLKQELEKYRGVVIYTTRQKMEDEVPLPDRGKMAAENGSDLFISIHSNWFSKPESCGVSVYRSFIRPESEELGARLGKAVTKVIKEVTGITYMRNDGNTMTRIEKASKPDLGDGVNQDYYNVTRASVVSEKCRYSYIIEHGFHSNPAECKFLMKEENLKRLARAEAAVIAAYFKLIPKDFLLLENRHVEYRMILPTGSDDIPVSYEIPNGYEVDASDALSGGTTVRIDELGEEEYESIKADFPELRCAYAFSLSSSIAFMDIQPQGDVRISFPYPENEWFENVGAVMIYDGGAEKVMVTEDYENGVASVSLNKTGICLVYVYNEADLTANDTNGDGRLDNKDVVALFRFVSGNDVFVEKLAADINKDGEINNKDVVMLFRAVSAIDPEGE